MKTAPFREGVPYVFTKSFLMNQKTNFQIFLWSKLPQNCIKVMKYKYLNMNLLFRLLLPLLHWVSSDWFFHRPLQLLSPIFSTPLSCPWKLIWVDCNRFLQALVQFNPREPREEKRRKIQGIQSHSFLTMSLPCLSPSNDYLHSTLVSLLCSGSCISP